MPAAAEAAAVRRASIVVSKKISRTLLFAALLLIMWKMESGRERARYPHTIAFTITKSLKRTKGCYILNF